MTHAPTVAPLASPAGLTPNYRASCSCGWQGKLRAQKSRAQADAIAHVNAERPSAVA